MSKMSLLSSALLLTQCQEPKIILITKRKFFKPAQRFKINQQQYGAQKVLAKFWRIESIRRLSDFFKGRISGGITF